MQTLNSNIKILWFTISFLLHITFSVTFISYKKNNMLQIHKINYSSEIWFKVEVFLPECFPLQ